MARVGSLMGERLRCKNSELRKICSCLLVSILIFGVVSCNENGAKLRKLSESDIFLLKQALDSVDVIYEEPRALEIVADAYQKLRSDSQSALFIRTLRLTTTVLLSKPTPSLKDLDSAISFSHQAKKAALLSNDSVEWALNEIQLGRYLYLRGFYLNEQNELPVASGVLLRAIRYLERENNTNGLSFAYHWLSGATSAQPASVPEMLSYELRALYYNDSTKFPGQRAKICNDLAVIFSDHSGDPAKARGYWFRARTIFEKLNDRNSLSTVLANIGETYLNESNFQQSLHYFRLSAGVARSAELWRVEASAWQLIAKLFQREHSYDSAIFYNRKSLVVLKKTADFSRGVAIQWQAEVAKSYVTKADRAFALRLVDTFEAELPVIHPHELRVVFNALEKVVDVYQDESDLQKLADTQRKLLNLRNTIFSKEQMVEVGRIESQYEIQLKDKELEVLQLSLSLQAENTKKEKWIRILLIVGIAITTVGLVLVLRLLRQQSKFNNSLAERSEIIERQKHELENTLSDLQRTQGYMLTSEKMVMLGQFTAGVAHELNNPLNFISGGVSVLDDVIDRFLVGGAHSKEDGDRTSRGLREVLKNINNGVSRMAAIVESLQIFSNSTEALTERSEADVHECMEASLILIKSKLDRHAIEVIKSYAPVKVRGHSGRMSQVFINLIDNAIYALLKNPVGERRLAITMTITAEEVNISFSDNGEGIPEEIHRNIFNAFFTTKKTGQGTGLGLFICYNIIKDFGGKITFESKVGKGTTFTVSLLRAKFIPGNFAQQPQQ